MYTEYGACVEWGDGPGSQAKWRRDHLFEAVCQALWMRQDAGISEERLVQ